MHLQAFHDLEADGEAGVEAGHGFLEHHGHVLAGQLAALPLGQGAQVPPVELHLVGDHAAIVGDQAHDGQRGHALAGAGLADDAEDFALVHRQVDPIDRAELAGSGRKLDGKVADIKQRHDSPSSSIGSISYRFSLGSSASRSPSPSRLKASTVIRIARPGNVTTHHARLTNSRADASMVPHSGVGG